MICVLGPNGQLGLPIVKKLSQEGYKVRALAHSEGRVAELQMANVEVMVGDFTDTAVLRDFLAGADQLYLQTPNEERQLATHIGIIDAAVAAGVKSILKISAYGSIKSSLSHICRDHWRSDTYLQESGIPYTIVHGHTFMQTLGFVFGSEVRAESTVTSCIDPDAEIAMLDIRDLIDVVSALLMRNQHANEMHLVTGGELVTYNKFVEKLSKILGRKISYNLLTEREQIIRFLDSGMSDWYAEGVKDVFRGYSRGNPADIAHYNFGGPAQISDATQSIAGHSSRSFDAFLHDYIHLFR